MKATNKQTLERTFHLLGLEEVFTKSGHKDYVNLLLGDDKVVFAFEKDGTFVNAYVDKK